jgi:hypothetical protein
MLDIQLKNAASGMEYVSFTDQVYCHGRVT